MHRLGNHFRRLSVVFAMVVLPPAGSSQADECVWVYGEKFRW
jgi:hypothetical protein